MHIGKDKSFNSKTPEVQKRVLNAATPLKSNLNELKIFHEINHRK